MTEKVTPEEGEEVNLPTQKSNGITLTEEDISFLRKSLDNIPESETLQRLKKIVASGSVHQFVYADEADLSAVDACMSIVARWRPDIDREGYIVEDSVGDYDNIDEIDKDSMYLDSLNTEVGQIMGKLNAQVEAAKLEIEFAKSRLRSELRKMKKTPRFRRKVTEEDIRDITRTHEKFEDAVKTWISLNELAKVVTACYYSTQRVADRLNQRVRTLTSQWGRETH